MKQVLFLATNRDPKGEPPKEFGITFNPVHPHELRFGQAGLEVADGEASLSGTKLADRLSRRVARDEAEVAVFREQLARRPFTFGSAMLFERLKGLMDRGADALVFIHGYNVSFAEAVGSALALQVKLRGQGLDVQVVLFSWPSDGRKTAFKAYKRDRDDAASSGIAFSRGFQKLFDFLAMMKREEYCGRGIHLLCHSMGNLVLENTLWHLRKNVPGVLPRIFGEIILSSADVDDDAFEQESKFRRLSEIARRIHVYYNRGDRALQVSDLTKGNPDRLGESGPKHPLDSPSGVVNVDCTGVVPGLVEHSYYLDEALPDVAETLRGTPEDKFPKREYVSSANAYRLLE